MLIFKRAIKIWHPTRKLHLKSIRVKILSRAHFINEKVRSIFYSEPIIVSSNQYVKVCMSVIHCQDLLLRAVYFLYAWVSLPLCVTATSDTDVLKQKTLLKAKWTLLNLVLWRCGSFFMTMAHLHRWWEHVMQLCYSWFTRAASVFSYSWALLVLIQTQNWL